MAKNADEFKKPFWPTVVAASVFAGLMIIGFEIGRSAGEDKPVAKKPQPTQLAKYEKDKEKAKPTTAPTEKAPESTKPKAEPTKPKAEPTKPASESTKPKPEPTKPVPPTTKPEPKPDPPTAMVSYQDKILPIFKAKCNVCHGDPSIKGDLDLRSLMAIKKSPNPKVISPGNPDDSEIYLRVKDGSMPPPGKDKMTEAEIKLVLDWVKSGGK